MGDAGKALEAYPVGSFIHTNRLPGTAAAATSAVKRAHRRGDLLRVGKGVYFKGPKTRYGMARPPAAAIAREVLGDTGAGPTGFSAARAFGLTTQVPAQPSYVVTGRHVPTGLPGVKVSTRANPARATLKALEIAVLELLRGDWESTVDDGWTALVEAVGNAVASGRVRWRALTAAADNEKSPSLRRYLERLGTDLQASGILA